MGSTWLCPVVRIINNLARCISQLFAALATIQILLLNIKHRTTNLRNYQTSPLFTGEKYQEHVLRMLHDSCKCNNGHKPRKIHRHRSSTCLSNWYRSSSAHSSSGTGCRTRSNRLTSSGGDIRGTCTALSVARRTARWANGAVAGEDGRRD